MAKIRACVAKIQSVAKVLKTNDRFARPLSGYRDVQLQIQMSNGHVAELQIHLDALIKVKDGPGHAFYEQIRDIRDAALDQGRKLTAAEQKKVLELEAEMQKLYDAAFAPFAKD
jgi:hypothetical protein